MNKTPLRHMMLHTDTLADEFETIFGYRTSHAGLVLAGESEQFARLLTADEGGVAAQPRETADEAGSASGYRMVTEGEG